MFVRLSREEDKEIIEQLLESSFGNRNHFGALDNLLGRYLLAFIDDKLVAMTGLYYIEDYKHFEIDWTCTHPSYRGRGIMHELFNRICNLTDEPIYCSCWREPNKDVINLYSLMVAFNFKEVMKPRVTWDSRYNCDCGKTGFCVAQKRENETRQPCRCYEDLWVRETL